MAFSQQHQRRKNAHNRNRISKSKNFDDTPVTLEIERPAHGGTCVAHANNHVYFVRHAIPGESVQAQPYAAKGSVIFCDTLEVLSPSAARIDSLWPDAGPGGIGGGELCHVNPVAQATWKAEVVRDVIRRVGGRQLSSLMEPFLTVEDTDLVLQASPILGGRTRAEFVIDEHLQPAMYAPASQETKALSGLPLMTRGIQSLELWDPKSAWRSIWQVGDRIRVIDTQNGVFVRIGKHWFDSKQNEVELSEVQYQVNEKRFTVDPNGFWQAHVEAPELLQEAVKEILSKMKIKSILELYSGSGLLTQAIIDVDPTSTILAVEGDRQAVQFANINISSTLVKQLCCGIDANLVEELVSRFPKHEELVVLADPPRSGLGRGMAQKLADTRVSNMVLISCDPASFARDAAQLCNSGFVPEGLKVLDIFPGTYHMEIVSHFSKKF